jgi:SAM-dependent methyltransferase
MRDGLLERLRCPRCHAERSLELHGARRENGEIRDATVRCGVCGEERVVERGIVDLLPPDIPDYVAAESAGLDRFVDTMRAHGWTREDILELPYRQDGYWYAQATAMHQTLGTQSLELTAGDQLLDVGANACWASAMFAERGLDVTALDINPNPFQGLASSEWWFEAKAVYFERVLGVMFDLPFADATFDYCWCCQVLHHNHRSNLYRTMRELLRVLRPGGRLIVVNEPVRSIRDPKWNPGHAVAQYSGHEHAYLPASYAHAARRAGFDIELTYPWTITMFTQSTFTLDPQASVPLAAWLALVHTVRRVRPLRRAALAYKQYDGSAAFQMIATKPARL